MPLKIGYLLPTRERIMSGEPAVGPMLDLAREAEAAGFDSIWIGDSVTARPRHDPLTLMAAVAAVVPRVTIGTAVLLPALRNPVLLAHQVATIDQISQGRIVLGVGIARDVPNIRTEFAACGVPFERRVGRMNEGLALARRLWQEEKVSHDGFWSLKDASIGPRPFRPGGPPIWIAGSLPQSLERAGRLYDGWLPNAGSPQDWTQGWSEVRRIAAGAGRNPQRLTGAMYLTLAIDDDATAADQALDRYLESYYGAPAPQLRTRQACYAGGAEGAAEYLAAYARAGVEHIILRFVGDARRQMALVARIREHLQRV